MTNLVYKFFKIDSLNNDAKKFILQTSSVHFLFVFFISFANMFILLQAIQYLDKTEVALLLGIYLLTESIFAFPAGVLGDFKSFRVVLSLSVFFYLLTYQMVIIARTFEQFLLIYIFLGLSTAFHLENFFSFFDNNYDYFAYEDTNRAIYSEFLGKSVAIKFLVTAIGIMMGGIVAEMYSRSDLFLMSSIFLIITLFLSIHYYKDHKNFELKKKHNKGNFLSSMTEALKYSWNNRTVRFFMLGVIVGGITSVLWNEYFAISFFYSIGKNDQNVSILLSSEIIMTAILTGLLGILAGKVRRLKFWYLLSILITFITPYFGFSIFVTLAPIPTNFQLNYLLLFVIVYFIVAIPFNFNYILYYRTILDLIPEQYRGSIYSMISALKSIAGSIIFILAGAYLLSLTYAQTFIMIGLIGLTGSIIIFFSLLNSDIKVTIKEPIGFLTSFLVNTKSGLDNFYPLHHTENLKKYKSAIESIAKELTNVAMANYQISPEEKALIDVIITDVQAYYSMVSDFESKKHIDIKEKTELLKRQKDNILKHAYTNLKDEQMNEDLSKIIEKLNDVVASL